MEIIIVIALAILGFFSWQLYQAKKVKKFKLWLDNTITPELCHVLKKRLINHRSELFPNTGEHIQASCIFWAKYHSRVIQKALQLEIMTKQTIIDAGFHRQYQHILFIEQQYLLPEETLLPLPSENIQSNK